jgi:hypothetical protein
MATFGCSVNSRNGMHYASIKDLITYIETPLFPYDYTGKRL